VAICGCGLPVRCCQPAVAGGVIYADLRGELSTHLDPQALFTQSSVHAATATSFPLFKHTEGGETAPAFSGLRVYLQFTWEVGLPPSPVEFSSLCHSHKLFHSWLLGVHHCSCPLGQARLVYLQFREEFPSPSFSAQGAPSSLQRIFIVLTAYYLVSLFSLGGDWSVQRAMLIWPRVVCGSTSYHLAHLVVHVFPSCLGSGSWQWPGGPPGFSVQREVEMLCAGQRCGGVKVLPLLGGLACKVFLQCLSKISL
jgi:hypothetical protein